MAGSIKTRKRRRGEGNCRKKLVVHDKVEVKSIEDGFLGSWHPGRIIRCDSLVREVRYDHLLCDDKSDYLTECVEVSCALDGLQPGLEASSDCYGRIRPIAPSILIPELLPYGQCVDAYHDDAWWEGVVFDHEVASNKRNIFFPDLGDEHSKELDDLRPTHDWNMVTERWEPRGKWLFLEVIEDCKRDYLLPVSIKQMWYDVREMKQYGKLLHWSYSVKSFWEAMIMDVLDANLRLTLEELLRVSDVSEGLVGNGDLTSAIRCASSRQSLAAVRAGDAGSGDVRMEDETNLGVFDGGKLSTDSPRPCPVPMSPSTVRTSIFKAPGYNDKKRVRFSNSGTPHTRHYRKHWMPAGPDLVPSGALCHESIAKYAVAADSEKLGVEVTKRCRMHLKYLGWEVEFTRDGGIPKFRYITPEREVYYSLRHACQKALEPGSEKLMLITKPESENIRRITKAKSKNLLGIANPDPENDCGKLILKPDVPSVEPKYRANAVIEYVQAMKGYRRSSQIGNGDSLVDKARQHLAAMGWSFWYFTKRGKQEWRYDSPSPNRKTYYSLLTACRSFLAEKYGTDCPPSSSTSSSDDCSFKSHFDGDPPTTDSSPSSEEHPEFIDPMKLETSKTRNMQKRKRSSALHLHGPSLDGQMRAGLLADGDLDTNGMGKHVTIEDIRELNGSLSNKRQSHGTLRKTRKIAEKHHVSRVLRSSKRARQVVSSSLSQQAPKTVLSWLIDNNAILPRAKVHCYRGNCRGTIVEGRVTRDGIKCSCCQKVFTLSGFEAHADHSGHNPAVNIFLENGKSLADCQIQIMHDSIKRFPKDQLDRVQHRNHRRIRNDHICSLCHYGGTLMLCDHCPSSFHASCLGFQDVPEGDWFCQSCCCGICGRSQFDENKDGIPNSNIIRCHQCERQYHTGCVRNTGTFDLDSRRKWFCCGPCEQIHDGLQKLVGRPIPVGSDDLTWTLVKPMEYKNEDVDGPNSESMAENFIKLRVALDVMHECFEPVKEPRTRRDLVEDVIFSRGSELNRLNFRGFYTVLLERNEELITAATVRVYGDKVAEVPLVATRFMYRRLGMCRILINVLEKNLMELGVERLVLPAAPTVLNTWTASFGFSQMTEAARSQLLAYTFLDFQGTVMCQKLLRSLPLPEPIKSRVTCDEPHKNAEGTEDKADSVGNTIVSEVSQEENFENHVVDRERVNNTDDNSATPCTDANPSDVTGTEVAVDHKPESCSSGDVPEKFVDYDGDHSQNKVDGDNYPHNKKVDGDVKCYQRKKTLERRPSNAEVSCR